MSEQKRYTAQEMREMAFKVQPAPNMPDCEYKLRSKVEAMLSQAADAEDELRTIRSTWLTPETSKALFNDCELKTNEIYELKARLAAVECACEQAKKLVSQISMPMKRENGWCSTDPMIATGLNTIFSAIRGEKNENK